MIDFDREFENEMEFKREIRSLLWLNHFNFKTERNIGSEAFGVFGADRSKAAYVDFISANKGAWFIECKLQMGHSDFTKGLGQCIYYRHILKGFTPVLLFPSSAAYSGSVGIFKDVCNANGVLLCTEDDIVDALTPLKDRDQADHTPKPYKGDDSLRRLVLKTAGLSD